MNSSRNDTNVATTAQSSTPGESSGAPQRRLPKLLIATSVLYALWIGWLAYVAWVNVQAGNQ